MKRLAAILFFCGWAGVATAQMGPIESLVQRSPFLPPGYKAPQERRPPPPPPQSVPAASTRMELVGVATEGGEVSVSLRLKGEPRGVWLGPGESLEEVRFIRFDPSKREAVVENAGKREVIPLKAPSISAVPVAANAPQNAAPGPSRAAPQNNNNKRSPQIPVRRRTIIVPKQQ